MTIQQAYSASRPAEVDFNGQVTSNPRFFFGTHTHAWHESFGVQTQAGPVQIIDNIALAPRISVHPGDRISVRGEMVHDPGKMPVVHWTHHDPSHRHPDGFIELRGRVYA